MANNDKKTEKKKPHKTNWLRIFLTFCAYYAVSYGYVTGRSLPNWLLIDYVFVMCFGDPTQSLLGYSIGAVGSWTYILYLYIKGVIYAINNPKKK